MCGASAQTTGKATIPVSDRVFQALQTPTNTVSAAHPATCQRSWRRVVWQKASLCAHLPQVRRPSLLHGRHEPPYGGCLENHSNLARQLLAFFSLFFR
jgi:hypothetical protein